MLLYTYSERIEAEGRSLALPRLNGFSSVRARDFGLYNRPIPSVQFFPSAAKVYVHQDIHNGSLERYLGGAVYCA